MKRKGPVLAAALGASAAGLAVATLVLARAYRQANLRDVAVVLALVVVPFAAVGVVVSRRLPDNPIGPLFCAVGLLQARVRRQPASWSGAAVGQRVHRGELDRTQVAEPVSGQ